MFGRLHYKELKFVPFDASSRRTEVSHHSVRDPLTVPRSVRLGHCRSDGRVSCRRSCCGATISNYDEGRSRNLVPGRWRII
jgi:hypothetical protein